MHMQAEQYAMNTRSDTIQDKYKNSQELRTHWAILQSLTVHQDH